MHLCAIITYVNSKNNISSAARTILARIGEAELAAAGKLPLDAGSAAAAAVAGSSELLSLDRDADTRLSNPDGNAAPGALLSGSGVTRAAKGGGQSKWAGARSAFLSDTRLERLPWVGKGALAPREIIVSLAFPNAGTLAWAYIFTTRACMCQPTGNEVELRRTLIFAPHLQTLSPLVPPL